MLKTRRGQKGVKLQINGRKDEIGGEHSYQITFRTNRKLSAEWSKLRGLCKKFGHYEKSPELFEKVVLQAMRKYVADRGYVGYAMATRAKPPVCICPRDLGDDNDI